MFEFFYLSFKISTVHGRVVWYNTRFTYYSKTFMKRFLLYDFSFNLVYLDNIIVFIIRYDNISETILIV